jgi:hypothetical protein
MSSGIISIDPGLTIGIATFINNEYHTTNLTTLLELFEILDNDWELVLVENYFGGGRLSSEGAQTLRIVGAVIGFCYKANIPVQINIPSSRVSGILHAQEILANQHHSKHELEALSHLIAHQKRNISI